jgi:hypothetical protein
MNSNDVDAYTPMSSAQQYQSEIKKWWGFVKAHYILSAIALLGIFAMSVAILAFSVGITQSDIGDKVDEAMLELSALAPVLGQILANQEEILINQAEILECAFCNSGP